LSPSLNTLQPEAVAHGSEILFQAQGPTGGFVTMAELFDVQYDTDNLLEDIPIFGTRRTGVRRGRLKGAGTIKAYHLYSGVRSMVEGVAQLPSPGGAGSSPLLYLSQVPYTRYQIFVSNANWPGSAIVIPYILLVNVTLEKDTVHWAADKPTVEDINFRFEDLYGQ
jgi:hypothetical protein